LTKIKKEIIYDATATTKMIHHTPFLLVSWIFLLRYTTPRSKEIKQYSVSSISFTSSASVSSRPKVLVVGSGVGGLSIAARIATSTLQSKDESIRPHVTILEKNDVVGGRCGSFKHVDLDSNSDGTNTFRHERGPTLLLLPNVYFDAFQDCSMEDNNSTVSKFNSGEDVMISEKYNLRARQCIPAYRVVFDDGDMVDMGFPRCESHDNSKRPWLTAEIESQQKLNQFEVDGARKWDEYQRACAAFLNCGLPNFIEEKLHLDSFPSFLTEAVQDQFRAWPLQPHSDMLKRFFMSSKMRALASFQDLYVGLEPYRNKEQLLGGILSTTAPAVFGLLSALELHPTNPICGVYAPVGGFDAVTQALESLCLDCGVQIECECSVTKITGDGVLFCRSNSNATTFQQADYIIVNADLPYSSVSLFSDRTSEWTQTPKETYDWDPKYLFSSGVVAFHWSVSKPLPELQTHNVFLSATTDKLAESSWKLDSGWSNKTDFNFYVHRACATDLSAAPAGKDSILVLVPCETLERYANLASEPRQEAIDKYRLQFNTSLVDSIRMAVLKRLAVLDSLSDLELHIVAETVDTPATYADQYNVAAGTPFALSHGLRQLSIMRPGPQSSPFSNVFFTGASTRPGNGVPLVLIGAKLVAEKVVQLMKKRETTR
jgi:phytoene desaturase (3,4-didehydrolycopene-forming)